MVDSIDRINETDAGLLANLMTADPMPRTWEEGELKAVWRHQLSAPVSFDLGNTDPVLAPKLKTLCSSEGLLLKSFLDLLNHPRPPLELLKMAKDFAKLNRRHPRSPLPREVATALYYACIAAALAKCGTRITRMSNETLEQGLRWILSRDWIDDDTRAVARSAIGALSGAK